MPFVPSTYTPFFRRFGSERNREMREVTDLYRWVRARQDALTDTPGALAARVAGEYGDDSIWVTGSLTPAIERLAAMETHIWQLSEPAFDRTTMQEFVDYKNLLNQKHRFFANASDHLDLLYEGLSRLFCGIADQLPETADPTPFSIPAIYAMPEPRNTVQRIFGTLTDYYDKGLFKPLAEQMHRNMCIASGRDPDDRHSRKPLIAPCDSTLPLDQFVAAYLADTPFEEAFLAPYPLKLTHEDRFNHMHVVGGTGAGKTTLIENLIHHDLKSDTQPTVVLIDPHSDLVRRLIASDLGIKDRLIFIDPRDTEFPPALNIFALNRARTDQYDERTREQVTAGVIQTFNYLFGGLTNLALTGKQDVFFRYVARLMLSLPDTMGRNATILDMLHLMRDPAPYREAIERLPDIQREFFLQDFASKTFDQTKEQIRYRLQAIIENPTMARLFTSTETKVDLFSEMNRGAVILVDTAKDFLKENSATFGRLFISLVLQAVLERAAIAEADRKPTFLYVDEAASFFSSNIDDLLTESRKYKCGLVLAHQYLDQATGSLKSSLHSNTGIKFASGLSASDARAMASEMRTSADFILDQPKLQFAAFVRNVTPQAVSIPIRPIVGVPQHTGEQIDALIAKNREQVSVGARRSSPPSDLTSATTLPDEDISTSW